MESDKEMKPYFPKDVWETLAARGEKEEKEKKERTKFYASSVFSKSTGASIHPVYVDNLGCTCGSGWGEVDLQAWETRQGGVLKELTPNISAPG